METGYSKVSILLGAEVFNFEEVYLTPGAITKLSVKVSPAAFTELVKSELPWHIEEVNNEKYYTTELNFTVIQNVER